MRVFLINLDRSADRLGWFMANAARIGLGDIERIAAVDARSLDDNEVNRWRALSSGEHSLSRSELGCFLSHRCCWRQMIADGDDWTLILEDDVHLADSLPAFTKDAAWVPAGTGLVKIETNGQPQELLVQPVATAYAHQLRRLLSYHNCSGGYFVSREGARRLLAFSDRHCEPVDAILFSRKYGVADDVPTLQTVPALCCQDMYVSDSGLPSLIAEDRVRTKAQMKRRSIAEKVGRELRSAGRKIAARLHRATARGAARSEVLVVPFKVGSVRAGAPK